MQVQEAARHGCCAVRSLATAPLKQWPGSQMGVVPLSVTWRIFRAESPLFVLALGSSMEVRHVPLWSRGVMEVRAHCRRGRRAVGPETGAEKRRWNRS